MNRGLVTLVVLAVAAAVAACAAPAPVPGSGPVATAPAQGAPPTLAPGVREPKDARGIPACELLTDAQLLELDLIPGSARELADPVTGRCGWSSAIDDTNPAGLEINTVTHQAALDIVYGFRDTFERFEPTEVAGHPAVRADDVADNSCALYVGIADHQAVSIEYNLANRPLPDPCEIPRRMGEFILSNLPPLT